LGFILTGHLSASGGKIHLELGLHVAEVVIEVESVLTELKSEICRHGEFILLGLSFGSESLSLVLKLALQEAPSGLLLRSRLDVLSWEWEVKGGCLNGGFHVNLRRGLGSGGLLLFCRRHVVLLSLSRLLVLLVSLLRLC